jgi:hypothetical protein
MALRHPLHSRGNHKGDNYAARASHLLHKKGAALATEPLYRPAKDDGSDRHRGKYTVKSRTPVSLVWAIEPGAAELIRNLWRPTSDPRHVCGPECYEEHGPMKNFINEGD